MAHPIALLDACVLYPAPLRDLLLRLAGAGLFRARWTEAIHEEWMRNVLEDRPDVLRDRLERTRDLMNQNFLEALVTGYEHRISALHLPDEDDRHVLAAAIHGRADVLVTFNLKDFPASALAPHKLTAQHPDRFVLEFLAQDTERVCAAVRTQRLELKRPPRTAEELLDTLEQQGLKETVAALRAQIALL